MAGGLLNLIAVGNQNTIIHGDPQKTFFKATYAKHTNFGIQKFRIDYNGIRFLNPTNETKFNFKIPRYGDLLMDTYLVVKMPTIWSPLVSDRDNNFFGYEFKWIKDLGAQMIKEISITIGGQLIQKYSGDFIKCMVERDYNKEQKELFNEMTGNIDKMHSPEKAYFDTYFNKYTYPNTIYRTDINGEYITPTPSIDGRILYIPINSFWCMNSKSAFPLISLEYSDLEIDIIIRPIKELYTIVNTERDISGTYIHQQVEESDNHLSALMGERPYVRRAPDYSDVNHQLKNFLYPTKRTQLEIYREVELGLMSEIEREGWTSQREDWNADVHLIGNYVFLSDDEADVFKNSTQEYLFKDIKEHKFQSIHGTRHVELETSSLVSSWMFYFQRDDVRNRNEWSNFTNHTYNTLINNSRYVFVSGDPTNTIATDLLNNINGAINNETPNWNGINIGHVLSTHPIVTNSYNAVSKKTILESLGIMIDGKYRENVFEQGVYAYLERYRTKGDIYEGLYCYNFGLNTNPADTQPSGAINLSKFKKIEFEFTTIEPPISSEFKVEAVCAPGGITGILEKGTMFNYDYDLKVFEERYNVIEFKNGMVQLLFSR
jgi:hypothetical protein